jgi:glycosyltransferase involved in cell wall biosynthesis
LEFAGYETVGHIGYTDELLAAAARIGSADRVRYAGKPPTRSELYELAAKADIGLALFARVLRQPMAGASNKPFDYLACGLALVLPDSAEWMSFYGPARCGRWCDPVDPRAIADAIRAYLEDPDKTRAMGEAGRRRILVEWNYEAQFAPVKRFLERLAGRPGERP